MKVRIPKTYEVSEEQAVINGKTLLAKDLRELLGLAVEELIKGRSVNLAELQVRLEMMAFLTTPKLREQVVHLLLASEEGKKEALRFLQTPKDYDEGIEVDPDQLAGTNHCDGSGYLDGRQGSDNMDLAEQRCPGCPACQDSHYTETDESKEINRGGSSACVRCHVDIEDDKPGICEGCAGRLHPACRAEEVADAVDQFGPMPPELRGGALTSPFICGLCIRTRLAELDDDEENDDIGHEASD